MALYEHVLLARQDVSAQQVEALIEQFKGIIEANGGTVTKIEYWGVQVAHLPHQEEPQGALLAAQHRRPAAAVLEMERQMRINEDVLRFLTVRVEELEEGQSAMLQKRDRDDRGERGAPLRPRRRPLRPRRPRRDRPRRDDEAGETTSEET